MLNKLSNNSVLKQELAEIDAKLYTCENLETKDKINNLRLELIRLTNLMDEFHLAENRKFVSIHMIEDTRRSLVDIRYKLQKILKFI